MKLLRPEEVQEFPEIRTLTPEEVKEVLALRGAAFTAADLQRYTELDECLPAEDILAELEAQQQAFDQSPRTA